MLKGYLPGHHFAGVSHFFPTPNTLVIWSEDILVRLFVLVNAKADRNVSDPKKVRCALSELPIKLPAGGTARILIASPGRFFADTGQQTCI